LAQNRAHDAPSSSAEPDSERDEEEEDGSKSAGPSMEDGRKRGRSSLDEKHPGAGKPGRAGSPGRKRSKADKDGKAEHEAPPVPKTPLEEAAAAASALCRARAKQSRQASGGRLVKCFHAGVRWGIQLPPDALKTRSDLATALNDAFAGEILSCGRGDMLSITFLDREGGAVEFPPLRSSLGARESATKWKASVDKAAKIYVMR